MNGGKSRTIAIYTFVLGIVLGAPQQAHSQEAKTPYSQMAPIAQYLTDKTAEIALARSAAPPSISADADVLVLTPHGYETAVKGKNGNDAAKKKVAVELRFKRK